MYQDAAQCVVLPTRTEVVSLAGSEDSLSSGVCQLVSWANIGPDPPL